MSFTAAVILNYKAPHATLNLIESLNGLRGAKPRVYVVDNNSQDDSAERLKSAVAVGDLILSPKNLGYAGGMNLGIKKALADGAEWIWILTQDLTVEPDALEQLHTLWPQLDSPGMLGALTDLNGTDKVYFYRSFVAKSGHVRHKTNGRSIQEIPELLEAWGETDYVNGACVFTHRSVVEKVGLIPEEYFLYFEDSEWGLRARRLGFKHYVSYRARAHHHREVGGFSPTAEYYCRRNALAFKQRNGFARPWTKTVEILKLTKALLKTRLKSRLHPEKPELAELAVILRDVLKDVKQGKLGARR